MYITLIWIAICTCTPQEPKMEMQRGDPVRFSESIPNGLRRMYQLRVDTLYNHPLLAKAPKAIVTSQLNSPP
jgi:hypothetical protein